MSWNSSGILWPEIAALRPHLNRASTKLWTSQVEKCKYGKDELFKTKERKKKKKAVSTEWLSQEPDPSVVLCVLRGNLELGNVLKASRIRLSLAEKVQSLAA